jgi:hypothetical protein
VDTAKLGEFIQKYKSIKTTDSNKTFNILKIADVKDDERKHTKILAWLLDRTGSHRQDRLFFDAFVRLCGIDCGNKVDYQVNIFPRGSESENDVRIYAVGRFAIDVEIKVNAVEGHNQCANEYRDLQDFADTHNIPHNARFAIFITPDGKPPTTAGPDDNWISRSWKELGDSFSKLVPGINYDKLTYMISDWLEIMYSFKEEAMDWNSKEARFLFNNYATWTQLARAWDSMLVGLSDFLQSLEEDVRKKPWWTDGWHFYAWPAKDRKREISVAKATWKTTEAERPIVQVGVEHFTAERLFDGDNTEKPWLYVWVSDNSKTWLVDAIRGYLRSTNKILPGDDVRDRRYPLIRYIEKYAPESIAQFETRMKDVIVSFIDDYASILNKPEFDSLLTQFWP